MKKLTALILALMMCFGCVGSLAQEAQPLVYLSDFSNGTDGFYARSMGGASISVADGVLTMTGRSQDWNSPGRDFPLVAGTAYDISVQVCQNTGSDVNFMISIAHMSGGMESYENIASATAPSGQWVEIKGTYKPAPFDTYVLYVETSGAAGVDFMMKDFAVVQQGAAPVPTEAPVVAGVDLSTIPSLKEVYAENFDFGCAVNGWDARNKEKMDFYASQFSIMTHENDLKPDSVLDVNASRKLVKDDPTAVAVKFDNARPLLQYCQENGIQVHGHVLVWHNQTPEEFFHEEYDRTKPYVTREVMLGRLENYIREVLTQLEAEFPGVIVSWDVVNEAVADGKAALRESNWTKVVGEDFVNQAFAFARKYASEDTLLFYNDYSTPYEPKLTGICNLLDSLIADGNIDGYGFQCHYQLNSPSTTQLRNALTRIMDKDLLLRVSELDITISDTSEATLLRQAERYKSLMTIFSQYGNMIAVQTWGVTDDRSWKSSEYPLLFDRNQQPKYAFWALTDPSQLPADESETTEDAPASLPVAKAVYGRDALETAPEIPMKATLSADAFEGGKVSATAQAAWDEKNLYVLFNVVDPWLSAASPNSYEQDSVELFLDETNNRSATYDDDDHHYRVNFNGELTIDNGYQFVTAQAVPTGDGFMVIMTVPFTRPVEEGSVLGFDVRYNDAAPDGVRRLMNFCDASDTGWNDPTVFGLLELTK